MGEVVLEVEALSLLRSGRAGGEDDDNKDETCPFTAFPDVPACAELEVLFFDFFNSACRSFSDFSACLASRSSSSC